MRHRTDTTPRDPVRAPDEQVAALGTILGVWAHPDDEVYLSAGIMALARDAGQRVVCVTATRGDHGTPDPVRWPPDRLAALRSEELRASLALLGVDEHRFLDHEDGSCADADPRVASEELAAIVAEVRPDSILTFGPDGVTGHPDHRAVSAWVTAARRLAAPDARLFQAALTDEHLARWGSIYDEFDVFMSDDAPVAVPSGQLALDLRVSGTLADRKLAALRAQPSQTEGVIAHLGASTFLAWCANETFVAVDH